MAAVRALSAPCPTVLSERLKTVAALGSFRRPRCEGAPLQPQSHVLVELDGASVPGLVLRLGADGQRVLVTYEQDGKVATSWLPVDQVRAPA